MAYASRAGRARTSSTNPQAFGVCDRCGIWTNRINLRNQYEWRGASLKPLYIYVCNDCYDIPQEQLRAIVIPADPVPIVQPRTEPFLADETTYLSLGNSTVDPVTGLPVPSTTTMVTVANSNLVTEPLGLPKGLLPGAIMPQQLVAGVEVDYGEELPWLAVYGTGTDVVTVTCSQDITQSPWNLQTGSQISTEGLSNINANGFFSITLVTSTMFTYHTWGTTSGGMQTGGTSILTCRVGVPLGWNTIPTTPPGAWEIAPEPCAIGSPVGLLLLWTYSVCDPVPQPIPAPGPLAGQPMGMLLAVTSTV
jgi:hypothetical protein